MTETSSMLERHARVLVLAIATVSAACSDGGGTPSGAGGQSGAGGAGGTADNCPLVPYAGGSCTEDCTWDEVAAKTAYCCTSGATTVFVMLVAECDGYRALLKRGYDTSELKYYDAATGALVASTYQGGLCSGPPAAPPGCTLGPFHRLADWCGAYAADGRPNAHCCELPSMNRPTWEGLHAAFCPASTQAGECGSYHALIDYRPYDGAYGTDETWYYDSVSGALTAVVDAASGIPVCIAGPADGFVPPTCAPTFAPFCTDGGI